MKVLALTRYGRLGASSRVRSIQYLPWLEEGGMEVTFEALISDELLRQKYQSDVYPLSGLIRSYVERSQCLLRRHQFDLIWIEKEALPWAPVSLELALLRGTRFVLDYDDAVFHNYDMHSNPVARWLYGRRLDTLMAKARLVVAGNDYLAQRAHDAGATRVEVVPTVIDLAQYPSAQRSGATAVQSDEDRGRSPRVVWIGSPATVRYLQLLREPLRALAVEGDFVLRVIGGGNVDVPGVRVETVPWAEATEAGNIGTCDVGVMPLVDSAWERGKCGYKLIQYMACGLPVVASNVGVNAEIVRPGINGFLAKTPQDWVAALSALLTNAELRTRMGLAGRELVQQHYCIQRTGPRLTRLMREIAAGD